MTAAASEMKVEACTWVKPCLQYPALKSDQYKNCVFSNISRVISYSFESMHVCVIKKDSSVFRSQSRNLQLGQATQRLIIRFSTLD